MCTCHVSMTVAGTAEATTVFDEWCQCLVWHSWCVGTALDQWCGRCVRHSRCASNILDHWRWCCEVNKKERVPRMQSLEMVFRRTTSACATCAVSGTGVT